MAGSHAYLDYNASAPLRPAAREAMLAALGQPGNASSVHGAGRRVKALVDEARDAVAALVDADPGDVVFTAGATEAANLAIRGLVAKGGVGRIVHSGLEHDAVAAPAKAAGVPVTVLGASADGTVRPDDFVEVARAAIARGERPLVALMLANNETGVLQPVAELVAALGEIEAPDGMRPLVLCDAAQGAGKIPVSLRALGADAMTLSAHKMGGPQGAGALVLKPGAPYASSILGGGQEARRRAGTENAAALAGFGAAARAASAALKSDEPAIVAKLRDRLEADVLRQLPGTAIFGANAPRLPNTTTLAQAGLAAETQVIGLDLAGVAVSAGAACSSGKVTQSPVLAAMGVADDLAGSAIRVSLGWASTDNDVDRFLEAYGALVARAGAGRTAPRVKEMTA